MENPPTTMNAFVYTLISVLSGIMAAIFPNIEITIRILAALAAAVSAVFAARYYHIAYLEKQQSLKNLKSKS